MGYTERGRRNCRVVLVVDDDPMARRAVARCLDEPPYLIVQAPSVSRAVELMGEMRVDAVIAELDLPGMTAPAFMAYVGERFPDCLRLILSRRQPTVLEVVELSGISPEQILKKGVTANELQQRLATLLCAPRRGAYPH